MIINITFFEQPIGKFALGKMRASDIIKIMTKDSRKYDPLTFEASGGVQRELSSKRLNEIANYAKDEDACFPTAIILSLPANTENNEESPDIIWELIQDDTCLKIKEGKKHFALLVDGQHRMYGLEKAGFEIYSKFEIPVVFLFEATLEQQAMIFSIINEKQTKVSYSLVSQLFGVIEKRTCEKVAHMLATSLNSRNDSPFYQRVKMLGKKSSPTSNETLSQGTIVRQLIPLLSDNNKNNVFNSFYKEDDDGFILKVLLNYFNAAKKTWNKEWASDNYILTKTVGFTALIKALPYIFVEIDNKTKNFQEEVFMEILQKTHDILEQQQQKLTSDCFPSSGAGANNLKKIIEDAAEQILCK